eukprot:2678648-Prymnesium_polylepis.1
MCKWVSTHLSAVCQHPTAVHTHERCVHAKPRAARLCRQHALPRQLEAKLARLRWTTRGQRVDNAWTTRGQR